MTKVFTTPWIKRQGDHVAIGHVADFMRQHRAHFIRGETFEQALADGYQCVVAIPSGGEGVGLVGREDTDLGHLDAGFARQLLDGLQQPLLMAGARLADDLRACAHLRHPLGDEQRNQRSRKAEHRTKDQQAAIVLAGVAIDPEQLQGDAGDDQDRKVGGQKQENAHHVAADSRVGFEER